MSVLPLVHESEVDGVRVLWSDIPGPLTAALIFRAGMADETLPLAGICHLVEHLAMPRDDPAGADINATTGVATTSFDARGDDEDVGRFLGQVCAALADLPVVAVDEEVGVVRAELAAKDSDVTAELLRLRFGARAHGLIGMEPLGYRRRTGLDAVAASWARRYFTRANAVVCLSAAPPSRLELALAEGERPPVPVIDPLPLELPAWTGVPGGVVSVGMLGPWRIGLGTALQIAARRLRGALRAAGVSYDVDTIAVPLDSARVHRTISADCTPENAPAVRDGMLRVLGELASDGPTEDELRDDCRRFEREQHEPEGRFGWLMARAESELMGGSLPREGDYEELVRALTPGIVRDELRRAMESAILLIPEGADGPRRHWHAIDPSPTTPTRGREFRPAGLGWLTSPERLVVGADAISYRGRDRVWGTIRWADVELFGHDGSSAVLIVDRLGQSFELAIETWARQRELYQAIIHNVPKDRRVSISFGE